MPKAKKDAPVEEELVPLEAAEDALDEDDPDAIDEEDEDDDEADPIEIAASPAGKASAIRLLDLLVEKGGMALKPKVKAPSAGLIEAVAKILEAPGSLSARATKLSDLIVDSDDVDDLFVDDDTLVEILKRW